MTYKQFLMLFGFEVSIRFCALCPHFFKAPSFLIFFLVSSFNLVSRSPPSFCKKVFRAIFSRPLLSWKGGRWRVFDSPNRFFDFAENLDTCLSQQRNVPLFLVLRRHVFMWKKIIFEVWSLLIFCSNSDG